jgi:hypothetical protein
MLPRVQETFANIHLMPEAVCYLQISSPRTSGLASSGRLTGISIFALKFPMAKGKIITDVELSISPDYSTIEIVLQDKTALNFYLESYVRIFPELVSWKSGEYKPVRQWPPVNSGSSRR